MADSEEFSQPSAKKRPTKKRKAAADESLDAVAAASSGVASTSAGGGGGGTADDDEVNRASILAGIDSKDDPKIKKQRIKKTTELVSKFTQPQMERYEAFRQSKFPRATVKKTMQTVGCGSVNDTCALVMSGIAKVFVGEVVELARDIEEQWGETGPLQPKHIQEAYRRLHQNGALPYAPTQVLSRRRRRF